MQQSTMTGSEAMASVLLRSLVNRMVGVLEQKVAFSQETDDER